MFVFEHSIEHVMDNLAARFGRKALYIALPDDDHRPEKAWLAEVLKTRSPSFEWPARPLWLYPEPKLSDRPLTLVSAAERIENGWWDNIDVRRDYYIACDSDGACFWVYKPRHSHSQWFMAMRDAGMGFQSVRHSADSLFVASWLPALVGCASNHNLLSIDALLLQLPGLQAILTEAVCKMQRI